MLIKKELLVKFSPKFFLNVFYSSIQIVKNVKILSINPKNRKVKKINNFLKKKYIDLKFAKTVFGIGNSSITKICNKFGLNNRKAVAKCKLKTAAKINRLVNRLTFKKTLKIKLIRYRKFAEESLKNYKGIRYFLRYPIRGQRTHTNAKTRKRLQKGNKQSHTS